MLFNSLTFVLFFGTVLALHALPLPWRVRKLNLLLASYLFYAAWNPPFVLLLWLSTLVDWYVARALGRERRPRARRLLLLVSLATGLGLLGFFKYGDFLLENFTRLLALAGVRFEPAAPGIVLPVGISFYTFQTLSYTLDVYRGAMRPWRSFLDYALYVAFFPQLVAGPIVRAGTWLPQCEAPRRATPEQLGWGFALLAVGLFEKVILADTLLGPVADRVFATPASAGFVGAWAGTLAFSGQIFFDFSGYSTCAVGAALCLGFRIPANFRFPYAAVGFSEFWRRWHVSLSTWLRDYLYVPLGGNRGGPARTYANLLLTMLIGGLWHGAAWHFVAWGGLHGLFLALERPFRARLAGLRPALGALPLMLVTYAGVCIAWVFFRAPSVAGALDLLRAMAARGSGAVSLSALELSSVLGVTALLLAGQWWLRDTTLEEAAGRLPWWLRAAVLAGILVALATSPGENRAFIYFQF